MDLFRVFDWQRCDHTILRCLICFYRVVSIRIRVSQELFVSVFIPVREGYERRQTVPA